MEVSIKNSPTGSRMLTKPYPKDNEARSMELPPDLVDQLADSITSRRLKPDDLLFATREGTPISRNTFRTRVWRPAIKASGIDFDVRVHDLRHAHASWLLAGGSDLKSVMDRMGHARSPPPRNTSTPSPTPTPRTSTPSTASAERNPSTPTKSSQARILKLTERRPSGLARAAGTVVARCSGSGSWRLVVSSRHASRQRPGVRDRSGRRGQAAVGRLRAHSSVRASSAAHRPPARRATSGQSGPGHGGGGASALRVPVRRRLRRGGSLRLTGERQRARGGDGAGFPRRIPGILRAVDRCPARGRLVHRPLLPLRSRAPRGPNTARRTAGHLGRCLPGRPAGSGGRHRLVDVERGPRDVVRIGVADGGRRSAEPHLGDLAGLQVSAEGGDRGGRGTDGGLPAGNS